MADASSVVEFDPASPTRSRIADHKITRIDELLPWRYAAAAA